MGPATASKMERLGILSGADLNAKSLSFLREHFGNSGAWHYNIARGVDHRPVQPERPRKLVGAEDTFMVDIFDRAAARAEITPLAAKVWRHCEAKGLHGRTAMLTVKYADFQIITRSKTTAVPIATIVLTLSRNRCSIPCFRPQKVFASSASRLHPSLTTKVNTADQIALQI